MKLLALTLLLWFVSGTLCYYLYDLFDIVQVDVAGVKKVPGPKEVEGYEFSANTAEISTNSNYFAFIANTITTSDDYTFYCYFKFKETTIELSKQVYYTFFALRAIDKVEPWFTIRFGYQNTGNNNEGDVEAKLKKTLFIEQLVDGYLITTPIAVDNYIDSSKWQLLLIRIQKDKFYVKIDCNLISNGVLNGGRTASIPFGGKLTLTQGVEKNLFGNLIPSGQFIGAMYQPTIIVGADAFNYYSPCDADFTVQKLPAEPRPEDFNRTNTNNFIKLSSTNIFPVRIFCKDSDGSDHFSGTTWVTDVCWKHTCINGDISTEYICKLCEDPKTNKKFKKNEVWVDDQNPCNQKTCYNRFATVAVINEIDLKPTCKALSCNAYGSQGDQRPKNQCCDKCWSDTCAKGRQYYEGCDRPCDGGIKFECPMKKRGCWCPPGTALNDYNECIPVGECACKSGIKTYNAGQAVRRSLCETCVCTMGDLVCFKSCNY